MKNQWQFFDVYNNRVKLSFETMPFSSHPMHVWIICRYKGQWLLTKHPDRGLEFPGGKVEKGETAEMAARREVYEETGGRVNELIYLGQYEVTGKSDTIVKNVYFADIEMLDKKSDYFETEGPVLISELPTSLINNANYSFMMKDEVLIHCMDQIRDRQLV